MNCGTNCTARTVNHPCVSPLTMNFSCPWGNTKFTWRQSWGLGAFWGTGLNLTAWEFPEAPGSPRGPDLLGVQGSFGVMCKICGLSNPTLVDRDCRPNYFTTTVKFGPNIWNGTQNEDIITGYAVVAVSGSCGDTDTSTLALSEPLGYVTKDQKNPNSYDDSCGCKVDTYAVNVSYYLPPGVPGPVKLMVVPNTTVGLLPLGVTTAVLTDFTVCPTRTTTSTTITTTFNASDEDNAMLTKTIVGSFTFQCTNPRDFIADPLAVGAVVTAIATQAGVSVDWVNVTISFAPTTTRKLQELLQGSLAEEEGHEGHSPSRRAQVRQWLYVDYVIAIPPEIQNIILPDAVLQQAGDFTTDTLTRAVDKAVRDAAIKAQAAGVLGPGLAGCLRGCQILVIDVTHATQALYEQTTTTPAPPGDAPIVKGGRPISEVRVMEGILISIGCLCVIVGGCAVVYRKKLFPNYNSNPQARNLQAAGDSA